MSEIKDTERLLQTYLEHLPTPQGVEGDAKVLADALTAMQRTKQQAAQPGRILWRTIMTSKASKLTAAAIVVGAVLFFAFFGGFTQSAWALEDAIEAMKSFPAVYMVGAFPGGTAEIWIRAN